MEEREVRLKQGEEKKRRKSKKYLKIHLKNSLKGIEARRKSPIIYAPVPSMWLVYAGLCLCTQTVGFIWRLFSKNRFLLIKSYIFHFNTS